MDPAAPGIHAATSADGVAFDRLPDPIIAARPQLAEAFDELAVGEPFALVTRTLDEAEPVHVGLFFSGTRPGGEAGLFIDRSATPARTTGCRSTRFSGRIRSWKPDRRATPVRV